MKHTGAAFSPLLIKLLKRLVDFGKYERIDDYCDGVFASVIIAGLLFFTISGSCEKTETRLGTED